MTAESASVASGQGIYAGRNGASAPAWLAGMSADAFNVLSDTVYSTWAAANIATPSPNYRGTDPKNAVVDAYSDPAFDPSTGKFYLWGGGHGDGTYNGVIAFDPTTKAYSIVGQPTPPSVYLDDYTVVTSPIYYPSGVYFAGLNSQTPEESPKLPPVGHVGGFFLTAAEGLNATTDAAHIAPALGRVAAHAYAASVVRNGEIHYFCTPSYARFNIAAGTWSGWDVDIGVQLKAIQSSYTNFIFSQGNAAVYDSVTDRIIVLLQPGDYPMGPRNGVFVFNPNNETVESAHNAATFVAPSSSMVQAGRKVYIFTKTGNFDAPQNMNTGMAFHIDEQTWEYFSIQGDPAGTIFAPTVTQETIPAWYDPTRGTICRWNHDASKLGNVHEVNLTPVSGAGTTGDPYILAQTARAVSGAPSTAKFRYRGYYWPAADAMLILPRSDQNWHVLLLG